MAKVVVMVQVEDRVKWEAGFRTHGDLFRSQTVTKPISFTAVDGNTIVACFEPEDLATYMRILDSKETAEAMAFDGIKRETMKMFVLDQEFKL